ncbi:MAG: alpha/beta hydrolase [Magnetovibrio sp.]|nr:alpha/beta hydrolase [Magnetovibrio sp.]
MPEVIFNGPEGRLEGRYHHSKSANAPLALILHPSPQHGGTMSNKVVFCLHHCFVRQGFSVLRFNFRGVGRSQGVFDNGQGELSDAAGALDWMQSFNTNARDCWVAGFSFGAWISMQLMMRRPEINGFISVSPPASQHDFSFLAPCPASGLLIHGSADEYIPLESAVKLAEKLKKQKKITIELQTVTGSNHFFQKHVKALENIIDTYLKKVLPN